MRKSARGEPGRLNSRLSPGDSCCDIFEASKGESCISEGSSGAMHEILEDQNRDDRMGYCGVMHRSDE